MKIIIDTPRLVLRELVPEDDTGIFELDSDPEVHTFLGKNPITHIQQAKDVIQFIRNQYIENGTGRLAVIEKQTGAFIGWSGLKLMREETNGHINHYDLGYRFIRKHWGKGYATETAKALVEHGFNTMGLYRINAMADAGNKASRHVLEKVGLSVKGQFMYEGQLHDWFEISKI